MVILLQEAGVWFIKTAATPSGGGDGPLKICPKPFDLVLDYGSSPVRQLSLGGSPRNPRLYDEG